MNTTSPSIEYNLQYEINKASVYFCPVTMILTLITNILNICVLCCQNLLLSPCTHCFLAFALASLSYMCEVPVMMFIRLRFGITVTVSSVGCRLKTSLTLLWPSSVRMRNFSQVRVARRTIITTVILDIAYGAPFLLIYHFHDKSN
jgi:hypothetical protein